jgi:hypothetical protein
VPTHALPPTDIQAKPLYEIKSPLEEKVAMPAKIPVAQMKFFLFALFFWMSQPIFGINPLPMPF